MFKVSSLRHPSSRVGCSQLEKKLLMPPFYDPHLIIRNAVCNILRSWVSKLGPCFAGPHKVLKYIQQRLRAGEWPVSIPQLLFLS